MYENGVVFRGAAPVSVATHSRLRWHSGQALFWIWQATTMTKRPGSRHAGQRGVIATYGCSTDGGCPGPASCSQCGSAGRPCGPASCAGAAKRTAEHTAIGCICSPDSGAGMPLKEQMHAKAEAGRQEVLAASRRRDIRCTSTQFTSQTCASGSSSAGVAGSKGVA